MPARNSQQSYGLITRLFHWMTALLILAAIPLGLIANRLPYDTTEALARKAELFSLHKTLGIAAFIVALGRILWALVEEHPVPLHPERKLELWAAQLVHWLLYISLLAVPLSGWVHHAAVTGFAPIYWPFGQGLPFVPQSEAVAKAAGALHWIFSKLLIVAIALHIAGALKHHIIDRDSTLRRMTRGVVAPSQVIAGPSATLPMIGAVVLFIVAGAGILMPRGAGEQMAPNPATQITAESGAEQPSATGQGNWQVLEGAVTLKVQQMGQEVSGSFATWSADITFDETAADGRHGKVLVRIDTTSLTLGSVTTQAQGADFFDVARFPEAVFEADITADPAGDYLAEGNLTLRGAAVPVRLPFALQIDGNRAVMTGTAQLDRRDFGMGQTYTDEGTVGFSVTVPITLTAERR